MLSRFSCAFTCGFIGNTLVTVSSLLLHTYELQAYHTPTDENEVQRNPLSMVHLLLDWRYSIVAYVHMPSILLSILVLLLTAIWLFISNFTWFCETIHLHQVCRRQTLVTCLLHVVNSMKVCFEIASCAVVGSFLLTLAQVQEEALEDQRSQWIKSSTHLLTVVLVCAGIQSVCTMVQLPMFWISSHRTSCERANCTKKHFSAARGKKTSVLLATGTCALYPMCTFNRGAPRLEGGFQHYSHVGVNTESM